LKYHTGKFWAAGVASALLALAFSSGAAIAKCKLGKIADLPVTMIGSQPMVMAQINGVDAMFVADSGAFFSMISAASAAQFKLQTRPAPYGINFVTGAGGKAAVSVATIKVFTLAGMPLHNVEFFVGGGEAGSDSAGVLGQNVFHLGDAEYDLAKGVIRLMHEDGCGDTDLAYWAGNGDAYSMMDIEWTSPVSPHTTGTATVNGVKIRVMFDTGASTSLLSRRAAERVGVKLDAPGVVEAGYVRGFGRGLVKTWIAPFASFKLGDEEIRNTRLRISESPDDFADMLIGADFFLSHHVYVASRQHKLYFTYNGGPVFNLTTAPSRPPADGAAAPSADAVPQSAAPADGLKDAAELSRRGTAFAARGDYVHAIADLTRACELAPEEPNYFYERGIAQWRNKQAGPALSDFDQAIKLKPDHVPALVARAELRLAAHDSPGAVEDLKAADGFAAKEADARLRMASGLADAGLMGPAVSQLDLWIAAHDADARVVMALNMRCRARAWSGQGLDKALNDCNSALRLTGASDEGRWQIFDSRALVRLRLGDYDKSVGDFEASLKIHPKGAWALYGRGIDKTRQGRTGEGQADMAAATALSASVGDTWKEYGIAP
jgi:predicted aspartyl protease/tetratricopeptide (TPR) repeat protein